jgi:hypothetical protein
VSEHFDDACYGYWRCDNCGRTLTAPATSNVEPQLPPPWRDVIIEDYIGVFHCCKDKCELELRLHNAGQRPKS